MADCLVRRAERCAAGHRRVVQPQHRELGQRVQATRGARHLRVGQVQVRERRQRREGGDVARHRRPVQFEVCEGCQRREGRNVACQPLATKPISTKLHDGSAAIARHANPDRATARVGPGLPAVESVVVARGLPRTHTCAEHLASKTMVGNRPPLPCHHSLRLAKPLQRHEGTVETVCGAHLEGQQGLLLASRATDAVRAGVSTGARALPAAAAPMAAAVNVHWDIARVGNSAHRS